MLLARMEIVKGAVEDECHVWTEPWKRKTCAKANSLKENGLANLGAQIFCSSAEVQKVEFLRIRSNA